MRAPYQPRHAPQQPRGRAHRARASIRARRRLRAAQRAHGVATLHAWMDEVGVR